LKKRNRKLKICKAPNARFVDGIASFACGQSKYAQRTCRPTCCVQTCWI